MQICRSRSLHTGLLLCIILSGNVKCTTSALYELHVSGGQFAKWQAWKAIVTSVCTLETQQAGLALTIDCSSTVGPLPMKSNTVSGPECQYDWKLTPGTVQINLVTVPTAGQCSHYECSVQHLPQTVHTLEHA